MVKLKWWLKLLEYDRTRSLDVVIRNLLKLTYSRLQWDPPMVFICNPHHMPPINLSTWTLNELAWLSMIFDNALELDEKETQPHDVWGHLNCSTWWQLVAPIVKVEEFVPISTSAYLLNYYKKSWMLDQIKVNQNNITGVTVSNFLLIESLKIKKNILVLLPAFSTHIDKI